MKTKIFVIVLILSMYVGYAFSAVINGSCGGKLTWSLNTQDSTMTIEGNGSMTSHPWDEYKLYIKYVSLPVGLTSIASSAFADCVNLAAITIPNGLVSIGTNAFDDCESLKSINIPSSVTSIGSGAFSGCIGLKEVHIDNLTAWCNIPFNSSYYSNPLVYAHHLYLNESEIRDLIIPEGLSEVKVNTFLGCHGLTSVTIPDGVTKINARAFRDCIGLTKVTLGKNVNSLEHDAFDVCNNVTRLTIYAATPPTGGTQCGINNLSCSLFVPAESVEIYASTAWWEDFNHILSIGSNAETYRVEFRDWDGKILKIENVEYGFSATAPETPSRTGYTFIGWDKSFENITSNIVVTAQYEIGENINCSVIFSNGNNGNVLFTQYITLKFPAAPEIEGFNFLGWRPISRIITQNVIEIEAVYESISEAAPEVVIIPSHQTLKLVRNGNVYILRDGRTYTATGQEVR